MHSDGAIVFKTKIDNSDVQKDLDKTKREIDKTVKTITETEAAKLPLVKEAEELKVVLHEAREELSFFQDEQAAAQAAMQPGAELEDYMAAHDRLPAINTAVEEQKKKVDSLKKEWDQVNKKIDQYDQKLDRAKATLEEQKAEAGRLSAQLNKGGIDMSGAMEKAQKSADKFKKRISSIISQVFVFTLVSKALQSVTEYMGKALKSNKEFNSELAKLKGALLTAFQPVYELLVPALLALMRIATNVVTAIAKVAALLGGKSMSQYAKSAKALYEEANAIETTGKAAQKAQKSLAGFDEINRIASSSTAREDSSQDMSMPDFSQFDAPEIQQKVDELTIFLSGALLVMGVILAFSGANIPLGIGMMAVGAVGLAAEASVNWNTVREIIDEQISLILAISSILLVIGMILAFTGAAIPLGIGLMVIGAAGLATAAVVSWDSIKKELESQTALITAISALLLVIGLVLAFSGAALPLGIGLIAVGAVGLVTEAAVNWNAVEGPLSSALATLTAIMAGASIVIGFLLCMSGAGIGTGLALIAAGIGGAVAAWNLNDNPITRFVKGMVNGIIGMINMIIDAVNSLFHLKFDGLKLGEVQVIPEIDTRLLNIPKIPMLAKGAVIPPNREFMAILGDQRHGTNIEAPLSTIQEAVAAVMAEYEASNLAGHEATVEVLRDILEAILGISIGDEVIGQAVSRYNRKMAVIRGGG